MEVYFHFDFINAMDILMFPLYLKKRNEYIRPVFPSEDTAI